MNHIRANGLEFAYLEQGSGPLVLLLHGFPDTAHTWEHALPALAAAGVRAVAPFLRGYHPTEVPADDKYDVETLGRDVIALIEALGADRAIVVGHDWGAASAYAAAALAPDKIRALVTLAIPHPASLRPSLTLAWKVRHFLPLRRKRAAEALARRDYRYVDTLVARWSPAWTIPAGETDRVKAAFREPGCAAAACAYYRDFKAGVPRFMREPLRVPAVAFAGLGDMIAPRAYEKARNCYASSYEVVQVPGGHFMHREHPDTFTPELVRVVREAKP
jgi:pimeloyl-ACP methyl ester carboxylesterase